MVLGVQISWIFHASQGVTTANGGIHLDTYKNGIADMEHEYGHYLQAQTIGSVAYYLYVVPASLWSATYYPQNHNRFWTELNANNLAVAFFGSGSAIAASSYYVLQ